MRTPFAAVGELAGTAGRGLLAGAVGTAAMTLSSAVEMKARGRSASSAPANAAGKILGVQPADAQAQTRFSNIVHWSYGTGWGAPRGLIGAAGITGMRAVGLHFLLVWGTELAMLPSLGVAAPPWKWGGKELAIDMLHHGVYATTTGVAYAALVC